MTVEARWPAGPLLIMAASAVGILLSLYSYFAPLTGITGSAGALLVVGSSLALVIDAVVLWQPRGRSTFWLFWVLGLLGAVGTIAAASFLHSWWLLGAHVVVLLGLIVTLGHRGPATRTTA